MSDTEFEILGTSPRLSLRSGFELLTDSTNPHLTNQVVEHSELLLTNDSAIDSTSSLDTDTATTKSSSESNNTGISSTKESAEEVRNINNKENNSSEINNKMNSIENFNNFMKPLPDMGQISEEKLMDSFEYKISIVMEENNKMKELLNTYSEVLPQFIKKLKNEQESVFDKMKNYIDKKFAEELIKHNENKSECSYDNIGVEHINIKETQNLSNELIQRIKLLESNSSKARGEIFEIRELLRRKDEIFESNDYVGMKNIQWYITDINGKIAAISEKIEHLDGVQGTMLSFESKIADDVSKISEIEIDSQYLQQQIDELNKKMSDITSLKPVSSEDPSVSINSFKKELAKIVIDLNEIKTRDDEKVNAISNCEKELSTMLEELNSLKMHIQNEAKTNTESNNSKENVSKIQKEIEVLHQESKKLLETAQKKFEKEKKTKEVNKTNDKSNSSSSNLQGDTKLKITNRTTNPNQPSTSSAEDQGGSLFKCPICYDDTFDSDEIYKSHYDICFELNSKQDQNIILGNRNSEDRVIWIDNSAN